MMGIATRSLPTCHDAGRSHRQSSHVATAACMILALGWGAGKAGLRFNTTESIPVGFYRAAELSVKRGDLVEACPPANDAISLAHQRGYIAAGFCPGGYGRVYKRVAAVAGDRISVTAAGVSVNGARLPNSAPWPVDPAGRALPRFRAVDETVKPGDVFLMGENALSFDGRYFGLARSAALIAVIRPLWTWQERAYDVSRKEAARKRMATGHEYAARPQSDCGPARPGQEPDPHGHFRADAEDRRKDRECRGIPRATDAVGAGGGSAGE
jgi:conjugative transfer signal peptidase TraF